MTRKHLSKAAAVAHRFAEDMYSVGMLDEKTMKDIDTMLKKQIPFGNDNQINKNKCKDKAGS